MNKYLADKITKASDKLHFPEGIIDDSSIIEIINNEKIRIENHKGIFRYSPNEIIIRTSKFNITVVGNNLNISEFISEEVIISGLISGISLS